MLIEWLFWLAESYGAAREFGNSRSKALAIALFSAIVK